jgi:phosphoglycerate dehydrogenase-like enzyme
VPATIYLTDGEDWLYPYREQLGPLDPLVEQVQIDSGAGTPALETDGVNLVVDPSLLDDEWLAAADGLASVQFTTVGYDHLDLASLEERGIVLAGVNRAIAPAAAAHLIDLAGATARLIGHPGVEGVPQFPEMEGKVLGIIGFGYTGMAIAHALEGTRCEFRYADVRTAERDEFGGQRIRRLTVDRVLVESDYVFITVPLTPQTRGLFDLREFAIMKPEAVLINGSAPAVINGDDLLQALDLGHFAAAAIAYRNGTLESDQRVVALSYPTSFPGEVAERVVGSIAENQAAIRDGRPVPTPVESIDFPVVGDPSFWSSRFIPRRSTGSRH